MNTEQQTTDDEQFQEALAKICADLVAKRREKSSQTDAWKDLFKAAESDGVEGLLSKTEHQTSSIILNCAEVIEQKYNIKCSSKLYRLIEALPFAMNFLKKDIENNEGFSCCADKTRRLYAEQVMEEIKFLQQKQ